MTNILMPDVAAAPARTDDDLTLVEFLFEIAFDVRSVIGAALDEPAIAIEWCALAHDLDAVLADEIRKGRERREAPRPAP